MPLTLGVRWQGKTEKLALADGACVGELQEAIEKQCGVARSRQSLKGGFPPKPLDLSKADARLTELGLRDRDSMVLQEAEPPPPEAGALPAGCPPTPARSYKVLAPDSVGDLERLVIPADNSCLFNSIVNSLQLVGKVAPMSLREAVRAHILADPSRLDAECQADSGKDSLTYAEWILKPDSWGGFIDLHILSGYLGVQICAICIRTLRVESFPNEPAGDARIFLLFDGIHYDCVVTAGAEKTGVFSSKDDFTLSKAVAVALELQEKKQFTDTANFTLQCQHCFTLLKGEADAQKHAKETGHFNFQEAK
mmetsp:Transcript_69458/g.215555  ORF Transcript_69458/g.215555 Transcript_69458/m.215555 type:complete len:309 (-) Transcript_69458:58-984(-)